MFFYLDYRYPADTARVGVHVHAPTERGFAGANLLHLQPGAQRLESVDTPGGRLLLLGDPVYTPGALAPEKISRAAGKIDETALYQQIRGHYTWFLLHTGGLCCGGSFGAIFPVYYFQDAGRVVLSSSSFFLAEQVQASVRDRRNLLERLLFNYPFFQSTWWEGIHLLDTHRHLRIDHRGVAFAGQFELNAHFGTGEHRSARHLTQLTEAFDEECRLFLPDSAFGISFTGGFDGRTLVAAALRAGRNDFMTYSFGRPDASDVTFPARQTQKLGLQYWPILLDNAYVEHHALRSALNFMRLTEYNGNFGRPHYEYAARLLSERVGYILTGNFGSELFRAMHQPGVMMSEALIEVFSTPGNAWKDALVRHTANWGGDFFRTELDALIADLERYLAQMAGWLPNQKFYNFVFHEIFRKYFGPELVMQSHYLNNRTPFLSLPFFRALNGTVWSGLHSNLFEKQKNKRLKGQLFYSEYLYRADKRLYRQPTGKGYSPADVREIWRRPLLLGRVALQKFVRREEADSNAVEAFFERYQPNLYDPAAAATDPVLLGSGLYGSSHNQADMEKTIKRYSIVAGWIAATQLQHQVLVHK